MNHSNKDIELIISSSNMIYTTECWQLLKGHQIANKCNIRKGVSSLVKSKKLYDERIKSYHFFLTLISFHFDFLKRETKLYNRLDFRISRIVNYLLYFCKQFLSNLALIPKGTADGKSETLFPKIFQLH